MNAGDEGNEKGHLRLGIRVGLWVGFIWVAYGVGAYCLVDDPGVFGDSFGALNTLFSGLAFTALVVALFMQQAELSAQLSEMKESREALAASAEANAGMAAAALQQLEVLRESAAASASMATAAMQQLENAARAWLVMHLSPDPENTSLWSLTLSNLGSGIAIGIRLEHTSDEDIVVVNRSMDVSLLREIPEFCGSTFSLAPRQSVQWRLAASFMKGVLRVPRSECMWIFEVAYVLQASGREVGERFIINPRVYVNAFPGDQ